MRTIVRTRDKNGEFHKFSFETSPLLNQDDQIQKIFKAENIDHEVIDWQYFDAHEIGQNINKELLNALIKLRNHPTPTNMTYANKIIEKATS